MYHRIREKRTGMVTRVEERFAKILVSLGSHEYFVDSSKSPSKPVKKAARKRARKRKSDQA